MNAALLAIVLWCAPVDSPFTVTLREKYGPAITYADVNCVIQREGYYYVTRAGRFAGQYRCDNYAIERVR